MLRKEFLTCFIGGKLAIFKTSPAMFFTISPRVFWPD
jgi:hypothetical protein